MFHQLQTVLLGALIIGGAQAIFPHNLVPRQLNSLLSDLGLIGTTTAASTKVAQSSTSLVVVSPITALTTTAVVPTTTPLTSASVTAATTAPGTIADSSAPLATPTTAVAVPTQANPNQASTVADPVVTSAGVSYTTIIVTTGGGSTWSYTSTGVSTSGSSYTAAPVVSDSPTSGLDSNTRKTVIGVVVGVGGAIFLALIFLVVWKLWGRGRHSLGEDDGLIMDSTHVEKSESSGIKINPFKSTLESYHNPPRGVNASSNF